MMEELFALSSQRNKLTLEFKKIIDRLMENNLILKFNEEGI
jgi:hypothetical protein